MTPPTPRMIYGIRFSPEISYLRWETKKKKKSNKIKKRGFSFFLHILVLYVFSCQNRDDALDHTLYLAYPYMSGKRGSLLLPASLWSL